MQDIDGAKRIQESLRQSEVRFERIFELVSTPMALAQCHDGSFKTINTAWEDLFGYTRYECMGKNAESLGLLPPGAGKRCPMATPPTRKRASRPVTAAR
jgi:PAS domain-containing protein